MLPFTPIRLVSLAQGERPFMVSPSTCASHSLRINPAEPARRSLGKGWVEPYEQV